MHVVSAKGGYKSPENLPGPKDLGQDIKALLETEAYGCILEPVYILLRRPWGARKHSTPRSSVDGYPTLLWFTTL